MMTPISLERLREVLAYDPDTGQLTWLQKRHHVPAGTVAGYLTRKGYMFIKIDGKARPAHQLAWLLFYGEPADSQIDHINGIKSDNPIANLRKASNQENQFNRGPTLNNTSGFKGVTKQTGTNRWHAKLRKNGRTYHLGYFLTPELAHAAYVQAAAKLHGEFARTA